MFNSSCTGVFGILFKISIGIGSSFSSSTGITFHSFSGITSALSRLIGSKNWERSYTVSLLTSANGFSISVASVTTVGGVSMGAASVLDALVTVAVVVLSPL